jgi:hypothetical protein
MAGCSQPMQEDVHDVIWHPLSITQCSVLDHGGFMFSPDDSFPLLSYLVLFFFSFQYAEI